MAPHPNPRSPLGLDLSRSSATDSPPGIAALFVIRFDIKTGYVISWQQTIPGVDIEGVVEYKSLPSGLHNVSEDLVYFVHEQYAGISAFVNLPAGEAERNAKMFAIGVLVPLSLGRLGKSWRHASRLKDLAQDYAQGMSNTQPISEYWETYQMRETDASTHAPESPLESPLGLRFRPNGHDNRNRAFSDAIISDSSRPSLTPFHPASSLPQFTETFGPLVFPLYRAALLRKRILLLAEAPVHMPCNFVYDLSLLASLPNSLLNVLPPDGLPSLRPRPLFNVGVHDIPYLSSFIGKTTGSGQEPSWIACTTDSVLSIKSELYDVVVTLPPPHSKDAPEKVYPKITILSTPDAKSKTARSIDLKATQRDARRYTVLQRGLRQISQQGQEAQQADDEDSDAASTYSASPIVEPLSWTRLAYTSFIWWASAGEQRDGLSDEEEEHQIEQDTRLLASVESLAHHQQPGSVGRHSIQLDDTTQQPPEISLVAYFRRLTTQIFMTLADAVARHDDEYPENTEADDAEYEQSTSAAPYQDDPEDHNEAFTRQSTQNDDDNSPLLQQDDHKPDDESVTITTEDMTQMGLDIWSATDRIFVEELLYLWWGRTAYVDTARIRCCGMSVL